MFKFIGVAKFSDHTALNKRVEFPTKDGDDFYGIQYFDVNSNIFDGLYGLLPKEVHVDFYTSLLVINDDVPPHTDIVDTACLNCYVQPGGYITNFYSNPLSLKGLEFSDRSDGLLYDKTQLIHDDAFQAKSFEIYLINNKAIHEVSTCETSRPIRKILQLATNKYSYQEVGEMLVNQEVVNVL